MTMLVLTYALNQMDVSSAFPISFVWNGLVMLIGPLYAEWFLGTRPMHKVAPVLVGGVLVAHLLATM